MIQRATNSSPGVGARSARRQGDLFADHLTIEQRFDAWRQSPGGKHVLKWAYRYAAGFAATFLRTGQRVSADYIWHILRYRFNRIRRELKRRGIELPKEGGYRLNDHFTQCLARHIVAHRTEWLGMFETRETGKKRSERGEVGRQRAEG